MSKETSVATADRRLYVPVAKMVHLEDERRPMFALCGFELTELLPMDASVDCVVCAQLDAQFPKGDPA